MGRTSKPRKAYRPHPVHLNAISATLNRVRKLSTSDVNNQRAIVVKALHEFSAGRNCAEHWRGLADTANMAETLAGMGICSGQQASEAVHQAQTALANVRLRHAERGTWTLYASEVEALNWLAALHGKQLRECDYGEFERAFHATHERVAQARAGNAPSGAIVIEGDMTARSGATA